MSNEILNWIFVSLALLIVLWVFFQKNGEGLGLGRAGTPAGVVVGMDTAVQHRTIPSIDNSRQATLCA